LSKRQVLLIDNYDSFTYNLAQYLWELGHQVFVYRNDEITVKEIKEVKKPSHILISPGPGTPKNSGVTIEVIKNFYQEIPILGICLGHQCIAEFFGAKIERANLPVHGKVYQIEHSSKDIFKNIKNNFLATRYHSLVVNRESLEENSPLQVSAITKEINYHGEEIIMGIYHPSLPISGLQFHPESIKSEFGHQILENFLSF